MLDVPKDTLDRSERSRVLPSANQERIPQFEMPAVTLKAHYDGERILLDEPFEIPPNSPLMVTVLSTAEAVVGEDWILAGRKALAAAYGDNEPDYAAADLRRP